MENKKVYVRNNPKSNSNYWSDNTLDRNDCTGTEINELIETPALRQAIHKNALIEYSETSPEVEAWKAKPKATPKAPADSTDLKVANETIAELTKTLKLAVDEVNKKDDENAHLGQTIKDQEATIEKLQGDATEHEGIVATLNEEKEKLQGEIAELKKQLEAATKKSK